MTRLFVNLILRRLSPALLQQYRLPRLRDAQAGFATPHPADHALPNCDTRVPQSRISCHEAATPCPQPSLRCCPPLITRNAAAMSSQAALTDEAFRSPGRRTYCRKSRLQVFRAFAPVALRSFAAGSLRRLGVDSYIKPSQSWPTIQVLFCVAEMRPGYAGSCNLGLTYDETLTASARATPPRSWRLTPAGVSPAPAANAATASSWPAPSSSTSTPCGDKSRRMSERIAR